MKVGLNFLFLCLVCSSYRGDWLVQVVKNQDPSLNVSSFKKEVKGRILMKVRNDVYFIKKKKKKK
jgi:hypothetical protein